MNNVEFTPAQREQITANGSTASSIEGLMVRFDMSFDASLKQDAENRSNRRKMWLESTIDPWAKKHGLNRAQALSVLFFDNTLHGTRREEAYWVGCNEMAMESMIEMGLTPDALSATPAQEFDDGTDVLSAIQIGTKESGEDEINAVVEVKISYVITAGLEASEIENMSRDQLRQIVSVLVADRIKLGLGIDAEEAIDTMSLVELRTDADRLLPTPVVWESVGLGQGFKEQVNKVSGARRIVFDNGRVVAIDADGDTEIRLTNGGAGRSNEIHAACASHQ